MNSYGLIDLHCDTLADWKYANTGNPDTLDDPGRVLQLSNMPNDVHWAQFYAVFIPDEERGDAAIAYFEKNRINFYRQMEKFSTVWLPAAMPPIWRRLGLRIRPPHF